MKIIGYSLFLLFFFLYISYDDIELYIRKKKEEKANSKERAEKEAFDQMRLKKIATKREEADGKMYDLMNKALSSQNKE